MLKRSRRHLRRYREIAGVLAKHGLGWMLGSVGISEHLRRHPEVTRAETAPVHLRQILEELGPTFVKLGQLLSTRPDIVPLAFAAELAKLQDTAPTLPVSQVYAVIEEEFGAPVRHLYLSFEETPIAAASLAQVHRATLRDGTAVIVKVQRPHIRELVETDIEILYRRAKFLEGHWERARTYGVTDLVDEFALTMREELNYIREARNTERLRENLARVQGVRVPAVYWELTTSRVLTLEMMRGVKVSSVAEGALPDVDRHDLSRRLASAFLEQVFVDGFFHSDPHPGNILVSPEGEIALVDCGQVGRLDAESREGAVRLLMAFEQEDTRLFADEILNLGIGQEDVDIRRLTQNLSKVLRRYFDVPSRYVNMGEILTRVLEVSAEHRIRLPVSFAVLAKVFANIDGICSGLDPDFNFTAISRDYVGKAVRKDLHPESALTQFYRAIVSTRSMLINLPENIDRLMRKAVEGTLRIEFKHQGLETLGDEFRTAANRIAIALIVGASIVGSSLVVVAGRGPRSWFGLPSLGVAGYVIASVFGAWLIVSILRSGRRRP